MPRSVYFSLGPKNEQDLYEDVVIEALKIYGHDVYYVPRTIVSLDRILNEDSESRFEGAYKLEAYVESVDGFEGEGTLLSKFGLEMRDQLKLVISRARWNKLVGKYLPKTTLRPLEGDLIYFPMLKGLFEIKFVNAKSPFYQLQNLPVYKLTCELFEYRGEDIDTGVVEVDQLQSEFSAATVVEVVYDSVVKFYEHEKCTVTFEDGTTAESEILKIDAVLGDTRLHLAPFKFTSGIAAYISPGAVITSTKTAASATVIGTESSPGGSNGMFLNDQSAQNNDFEIDGNALIDFSERNAFGEPDNKR